MARQAGYTTPERLQVVLDVVDYLVRSGFVISRPGRGELHHNPPTPIYVRNDSSQQIPPFACMQVTGTVEAGGQNYVTVDQPVDTDGTAGKYLFNGIATIEIGGYGIGFDGPLVRMFTDGSTVTAGDFWQPVVASWVVEPGGNQFSAVGEDDIETNVMRAFTTSGGTGSRLYRFTLNASLASGTADADILLMDGTDTTIDADVLDPLGIFASLTSVGDAGLCLLQDGNYYVIQAPCP